MTLWEVNGVTPRGLGHRGLALIMAVVTLGVILTSCGGSPTLAGTASTLTYCTNGGETLSLVLYHPSAVPKGPVPVVVYFHGGGWEGGTPFVAPGTQIGDVESNLVNHGWDFATVEYRLAPQWSWPAQIVDAKCAIRYLRASATFLHIDSSRIGVIGESAGGQLAALTGLADQTAGFDVGQYVDQSSKVQAVVDEYGPADLAAPDWLSSPIAPEVNQVVFGVAPGGDTAALTAASPVTYVAPGAPPFLVVQGADDTVVAPAQSTDLVDRLTAAHDEARLVMVKGAGHGLDQVGAVPIDPDLETVASDVSSFFFSKLAQPG
ncbi:MAG TPA: alpha/beta hydrolase [Acidimicrobiales bacterium]|nr:alpha/beta hydrolase [Acidimicrobiales bacterium]